MEAQGDPVTMEVKGDLVYRFRGRHYIIASGCHGGPQDFGQGALKDIPTDPIKFLDWKHARLTHFRLEEARILSLARASPLRRADDHAYWGYRELPSRCGPRPASGNHTTIQWTYVIDLDQHVFRISYINHRAIPDAIPDPESCGTQYFRLDNIPRWLFELNPIREDDQGNEMVHQVMTATRVTVPAEYWAPNPRQIPMSKPELLQLYQTFSTDKQPFFSVPPGTIIPTWKSLQLQLLGQFVEYFRHSFSDLIVSRKTSNFVRRQLAYAILCFMRPTGMKFNCTAARHKQYNGNISPDVRTPSWEPPTTDSYWLGDVLILLTEHIYFRNGQPVTITKAEIARAAQLATTQSSFDTVVILFSVTGIVIVNIHRGPQGLQVSHSNFLPLLSITDRANNFGTNIRHLDTTRCASLGIEALMNLFSARSLFLPSSAPVARPGNLPTELCEEVFRQADHEVQCELQRTCGVFRYIAAQYPRIGEWTLAKCTGENEFVARRGSSQTTHVVRIEALWKVRVRFLWNSPDRSGYEVGLWGAGEIVQLNMPLLTVVEVEGRREHGAGFMGSGWLLRNVG